MHVCMYVCVCVCGVARTALYLLAAIVCLPWNVCVCNFVSWFFSLKIFPCVILFPLFSCFFSLKILFCVCVCMYVLKETGSVGGYVLSSFFACFLFVLGCVCVCMCASSLFYLRIYVCLCVCVYI